MLNMDFMKIAYDVGAYYVARYGLENDVKLNEDLAEFAISDAAYELVVKDLLITYTADKLPKLKVFSELSKPLVVAIEMYFLQVMRGKKKMTFKSFYEQLLYHFMLIGASEFVSSYAFELMN